MKYSIAPHITEKAYRGISEETKGSQTYVFKVTPSASKEDIKKMVEAAHKVHVVDVRTVTHPGKSRKFKGIAGHTSTTKKALVRLAVGERIAAFDTATETSTPSDKE